MIAHTSVAVRDYPKSKELYATMLKPLGYVIGMDVPEYKAVGYKVGETQDFWLAETEKGSGVHVAFLALSKEAVDAFYKEAIAAGATDNGGPGYREQYKSNYYAAFVHDFDGNNIEAVWFDPEK